MLLGFEAFTKQVHTLSFLFDGVADKYSFDSTWRMFGAISATAVKEGISTTYFENVYNSSSVIDPISSYIIYAVTSKFNTCMGKKELKTSELLGRA